MIPARAVNRVVGRDVDVFRIRGERIIRNMGVIFRAGGTGDVDRAVFLRLDQRVVREVAGIDVIGMAAVHQVHGDGREHGGRAALREDHLVVIRNGHDLAQIGDGLVEDIQIHFRSVAHLHHGHAGTAVTQQLLLNLLEHGQRQHGRAGREVEHTFHKTSLLQNQFAFRFSNRQGETLILYRGKAFETSYHVKKQKARKRGRFSPGIDRWSIYSCFSGNFARGKRSG